MVIVDIKQFIYCLNKYVIYVSGEMESLKAKQMQGYGIDTEPQLDIMNEK